MDWLELPHREKRGGHYGWVGVAAQEETVVETVDGSELLRRKKP
jgi:hypothetical protein